MRNVIAHIDRRQNQLSNHPFFERLKPQQDLRRALVFAPAATFWVMTFQDLLRINGELARDPSIRSLLAQHTVEDSGHEEWFLDDLRLIFGPMVLDVRSLFAAENRLVREVSFALAAEAFHIRDDRLRLVLVEVLEAAAKVYFGKISRFLVDSGHAGRLKYFAGMHLQAEASHEMHTEGQSQARLEITLPPPVSGDAAELVDRMFGAFHRFGDALILSLDAPSSA